jgi:PPM family protein phosphatase
MALRVVERGGLTDVGRQREANEDTLVDAPPLFAVADGMGGAQAGEVASRTAANVLITDPGEDGTPEQRLTRLIREANRRIFQMAQHDPSLRGMGTTLTAAVLVGDGVTVGHVGDSRAYRFRDDRLEQLTHDHSLVAELERSGKLSPEDAEHHPQRSIITRALGPESDVEVDAHTHAARAGDVYLLCSDGLTGMVSDRDIAALLSSPGSLQDTADALVRAANQSGGNDNITVVLFRVGEDAGQAPPPPVAEETVHQGLTVDDVEAAVAEQERAAVKAPASRRLTAAAPSGAAPAHAQRRSRTRRALGVLAALALLAGVIAAAVIGSRQVWFVGTNESGLVTLYRGLPYELPLGIELYSPHYASGVPARSIATSRRDRVLDHEWRSRGDAEDLVRQLERGTLDTGRDVR